MSIKSIMEFKAKCNKCGKTNTVIYENLDKFPIVSGEYIVFDCECGCQYIRYYNQVKKKWLDNKPKIKKNHKQYKLF